MKNLLSVFFTALILISCGSDQEINDTKIFLNFSHNVDGNPVSMDDLSHTNLAWENYNVLTLKYLISDINLISNEKDWKIFENKRSSFFKEIFPTGNQKTYNQLFLDTVNRYL